MKLQEIFDTGKVVDLEHKSVVIPDLKSISTYFHNSDPTFDEIFLIKCGFGFLIVKKSCQLWYFAIWSFANCYQAFVRIDCKHSENAGNMAILTRSGLSVDCSINVYISLTSFGTEFGPVQQFPFSVCRDIDFTQSVGVSKRFIKDLSLKHIRIDFVID